MAGGGGVGGRRMRAGGWGADESRCFGLRTVASFCLLEGLPEVMGKGCIPGLIGVKRPRGH